MAKDKSKLARVEWDLYSESMGLVSYLKEDTTEFGMNGQYIKITDAATVRGMIKGWKVGDEPSLRTEIYQVEYMAIFGEMGKGQYDVAVDPSTGGVNIGIGSEERDLDTVGERWWLHPHNLPVDDTSKDIMLWKCAPSFENLNFVARKNEAQSVAIEFMIMADESQPLRQTFGVVGDWTVQAGAPAGVFLQVGDNVNYPYLHQSDIGLEVGARIKQNAWLFNKVDTGKIANIDMVSGITATDDEIDIENVSNAGLFVVGDYISIDKGGTVEYCEIIAAQVTGAGTKKIKVRRGIGGKTASSHSDSDDVELLDKVSVTLGTKKGTWAATVPADAKVGNTFETKGHVEAIQAGSSDITATVAGVASPALTVTVN